MEYLSVFVDCICEYCIENHLSIYKFAIKIGVAERAVAKWMTKEYFPTMDCAVKVADELNCSLDFLFGLTENKQVVRVVQKSDFISRFEDLSRLKNSTHYRIAKECEIEESTISKWMRGKCPKTETYIKLALYFGCTLDYLVGRE